MLKSPQCFSVCFCTLFLLSSFSLFAQKESITVKGLQASVKIFRDQWGMNHIYAKNQHDLFFAQGYCAAKDRLFQFEIWRRQATGTVAEILGAAELKRDIGTRLFLFRGDMKKELQHYHPQGEVIVNAYVDGVNAYISEALAHKGDLPFEFKVLGITPGRWTPEVVISRHQGLLGNIDEELSIGRAVAKAGVEKVKDLMWFHPGDPNLSLDSSITAEMLSKNILELYDAFHKPVSFRKQNIVASTSPNNISSPKKSLDGSNNWVVSGRKTASGFPILANDPHRAISLPSLRYMVHLVAPGWNVLGGGEPEIPGVSIGHNEHGAWGLTIFETDGEDLYVYDLNPKNLSQYNYKGQWATMKEIKETIHVKDSANVTVSLRYTVHGPVTFIDTANLKAYAVKCAWMEPGGAPYMASLRIDQAKNWKEFREGCRYSYIPGENMIWADKEGTIGWQAVGITPIRKNFSGMVPVPGDGRFEWQGYLDIKERPHLLNPEKGFFATANQNVTPADYKHQNTLSYTWADSYRGDRINEVLTSDSAFTLREMQSLQTDYFSIPARTLVPLLRNVQFESELAKRAQTELLNWNFVLDKASIAAGIYAMWENTLQDEATASFVPEELKGLVYLQLQKIIHWLQAPDARFGNNAQKGRDQFVKESFEKAIGELSHKLGPSITNWVYGQRNYKHTALTHPLSPFLPNETAEKLNVGPLPRGGNSNTPNSTGDAARQSHGASFRMLSDLADWDQTLLTNTPGQSGDPRSPYYKNLFPLWANDQYFPGYFTKKKIENATDKITLLHPLKNNTQKR